MTKEELIQEALRLFPADYRPEHFTDPDHCEECRDHNETLRVNTREDISFEVLGNPGWDPICFVNEKGFKYYFPAMVRLALCGTGDKYYVDQFLFHITQNSSCMSFNDEQSDLVRKVLENLVEKKTDELDDFLDADNIFKAIELWTRS
jgi:hypothetical protein